MPEPEAPKPVAVTPDPKIEGILEELPMVEVSDCYTFWESLAWHFKSRRSRLVLGGLLAIILVQTKPFGISEVQANKLAEYVMYLIGLLVTILTGEKFIPAPKEVPNPENDQLLKKLDEALAKLEEKENGQQ